MNTAQATTNPNSFVSSIFRSGGSIAGLILLVGSSFFLLNVVYQVIQAGVFDQVAAAMVGVAAVYCLISITMVVAFARRIDEVVPAHTASPTVRPGGNGPEPPTLRLVRLDSSRPPEGSQGISDEAKSDVESSSRAA